MVSDGFFQNRISGGESFRIACATMGSAAQDNYLVPVSLSYQHDIK